MAGRQDQLREEQSAVDLRYARLDELREQTAARLAEVRRVGPSGSPQNRSERDAFATLYEDRIAQLDAVEQRLCFGRLDLTDDTTRYIGRIGLTDAEHTSLLTDWRAPAAQAFYRATSAQPDGVVRRRHLVTRGRAVTGLEDEVLDLSALTGSPDPTGSGHQPGVLQGLTGEGALLAALATGRTGRMGDIVATIQAEQDAIIRSDLQGALVVQGGPGTGKTAVALHRAAYLLYAHRRTLERSGVLLIGPSHTFLRYIDQVLPSLGETGVVTTTISDLVPGVTAEGTEPDDVARIKGLPTMARVISRAVRQRQRVPAEARTVDVDGRTVMVHPHDVTDAIAKARRSNRPHNLARVVFVREMLARLTTQYVSALGYPVPLEDRGEITEELRSHREIRIALNLAWMPLTPQRLVEDLFSRPERLSAAAPDLPAADRRALQRAKGSPWTPADIPLLDEAAELLGEDDQAARAQTAQDAQQRSAELEYARQVLSSTGAGGGLVSAELLADRFAHSAPRLTTAERAAADRSWTYGHIVVDEAQELSPMAWRMLLRRCPTRSMTIVGDVAQTAAPGGAHSWEQMLDPVLRGSWRLAELTVNYRTPAEVARTAQDVARTAGLPVSALTSARDVPDALRVAGAGSDGVVVEVVSQVALALDELVGQEADPLTVDAGRVAVIAPGALVDQVRSALVDAGLGEHLRPPSGGTALDARVAVMSPRMSKGLEFDLVVLAEPSAIGEVSMGDLYVAMTRPTRGLRVVTSTTLPAGWTP
ncbi:UvrD-helicase domain-containing protein [Actinotalea sp. K2]|uniref:HelD family protein n=1 Tax=Actinotalea sp. K2 TaxID=2939438 RepID=UPI002017030B|nr:UvrD-helicase domain-containing protein [Actinotalea sp. K2]MCL3860144.1 AAA family ATPase [Actinotalea sp. K2]